MQQQGIAEEDGMTLHIILSAAATNTFRTAKPQYPNNSFSHYIASSSS
jgi:hypothetical protein